METLMKQTRKIVQYIEDQSIALGLARIVTFPTNQIEKISDKFIAKGNYERAFKIEVNAKKKLEQLQFQDSVYSECI